MSAVGVPAHLIAREGSEAPSKTMDHVGEA
jgi:hypothetical protein